MKVVRGTGYGGLHDVAADPHYLALDYGAGIFNQLAGLRRPQLDAEFLENVHRSVVDGVEPVAVEPLQGSVRVLYRSPGQLADVGGAAGYPGVGLV